MFVVHVIGKINVIVYLVWCGYLDLSGCVFEPHAVKDVLVYISNFGVVKGRWRKYFYFGATIN